MSEEGKGIVDLVLGCVVPSSTDFGERIYHNVDYAARLVDARLAPLRARTEKAEAEDIEKKIKDYPDDRLLCEIIRRAKTDNDFIVRLIQADALARAKRAEALLRETKRMLDDGFSIDEKTELYRKINAALAGKGE